MDKWFKDILPDKDPYHNHGRDQIRKKRGPEFECLCFLVGSCYSIFSCMCMFCRSLFCLLHFGIFKLFIINYFDGSKAKNIDICINFMGRTKTKPFLTRKKVPKLYFHFRPPKKCPPFFFLIHTW